MGASSGALGPQVSVPCRLDRYIIYKARQYLDYHSLGVLAYKALHFVGLIRVIFPHVFVRTQTERNQL